jgi:probable rRNA maturation factor
MKVNIYFSNMIEFNFSKSRYKKEVLKLVDKRVLSRYISKRCGKNKVKINYNFVSTNEQINMNTEFKKHNYNTDILTFDLSEKECELTGDVYISLKQIRKNTKRYGVSLRDEVNRVLIHGFLHLYGYNDETKEERNIMRKQEDRYLDFMKRKCSTWNMSVNHY